MNKKTDYWEALPLLLLPVILFGIPLFLLLILVVNQPEEESVSNSNELVTSDYEISGAKYEIIRKDLESFKKSPFPDGYVFLSSEVKGYLSDGEITESEYKEFRSYCLGRAEYLNGFHEELRLREENMKKLVLFIYEESENCNDE